MQHVLEPEPPLGLFAVPGGQRENQTKKVSIFANDEHLWNKGSVRVLINTQLHYRTLSNLKPLCCLSGMLALDSTR